MKCLRSFLLISCLIICAIELQASSPNKSPNKMNNNELMSSLRKEREERKNSANKQTTPVNEQNNTSNNDTPAIPASAKREFSVDDNNNDDSPTRYDSPIQSFLSDDHNDQPTQEANEFEKQEARNEEELLKQERRREKAIKILNNNNDNTLTKSAEITYVQMTPISSSTVEQEKPKQVHSDDTTDDSQKENDKFVGMSESNGKLWWSTFINSKSLEANPTTINHIRHALGYNIIEKADNNNSDYADYDTPLYDNEEDCNQAINQDPIDTMTARARLSLLIAKVQKDFNNTMTWLLSITSKK